MGSDDHERRPNPTSIEVPSKARGGFTTFDPKRLALHWRLGTLAELMER